jgi:hypothetical protein
LEETIMEMRKSKFGWMLEEWVAHVMLVGAVVTVLISGFSSLNSLPGV